MVDIKVDVSHDRTPPSEWPEDQRKILAFRLQTEVQKQLTKDVEKSIRLLDVAKSHNVNEFLGVDWDSFLGELTDESVETYRRGVELLRSHGHKGPISNAAAVQAARENPMPQHGEVGNGRGRDGDSISTEKGTTTNNVLRRLARDGHDGLLDAIEAGEISVNAAAIQAGYRKKKTPEELVVHHFKKCENQLVPLRSIVEELNAHQVQVVRQWLEEMQ